METKLSIDNRCFAGMRAGLDNELQETIQRMLDMRTGECSIGLKITIELEGVDEAGRKVPNIRYKISSSIPMKRDASFRIAEPVLLDEGPEGVMLIQEYEQTQFT